MRISDWSSDVCSSDLPSTSPASSGSIVTSASSSESSTNSGMSRNVRPAPQARSRTIFPTDRKSVGSGKSMSVRVDLGGRRIINQKTYLNQTMHKTQQTIITTTFTTKNNQSQPS